jgi:hypothetical protein
MKQLRTGRERKTVSEEYEVGRKEGRKRRKRKGNK